MRPQRKRDTRFRPNLDGSLETREAAANIGGIRGAAMAAFFAQRQAAFQARFAPRAAARPVFRAPVSTAPVTNAWQPTPTQPPYRIADGPTNTPLGELDNIVTTY